MSQLGLLNSKKGFARTWALTQAERLGGDRQTTVLCVVHLAEHLAHEVAVGAQGQWRETCNVPCQVCSPEFYQTPKAYGIRSPHDD